MTGRKAVVGRLDPIWSAVPELDDHDRERLERLDELLEGLMPTVPGRNAAPGHNDVAGGSPSNGVTARANGLLRIRAELARHGYANLTVPAGFGGGGRPAVLQALLQYVCGGHDLDLRDATGLGHGAMALDLVAPDLCRTWLDRLGAGELVGVAATERHGGSRMHRIATRVIREGRRSGGGSRRWVLHGEKAHVSRLRESAGFIVFFRDPEHRLSAALVDAAAPGLERETVEPSGLAGWSWGTLRLHEVEIDPDAALIAGPGAGQEVFHRHFTHYRPLVAATALGAAAKVQDAVILCLAARLRIGVLDRIRDNAAIALGECHGATTAALLHAVATTRLAAIDDPAATLWARVGKAGAVDVARRAVDLLTPLIGAGGFVAASPLIKARDDLAALAYADGIHDSLYLSGGRELLGIAGLPPSRRASCAMATGWREPDSSRPERCPR